MLSLQELDARLAGMTMEGGVTRLCGHDAARARLLS